MSRLDDAIEGLTTSLVGWEGDSPIGYRETFSELEAFAAAIKAETLDQIKVCYCPSCFDHYHSDY